MSCAAVRCVLVVALAIPTGCSLHRPCRLLHATQAFPTTYAYGWCDRWEQCENRTKQVVTACVHVRLVCAVHMCVVVDRWNSPALLCMSCVCSGRVLAVAWPYPLGAVCTGVQAVTRNTSLATCGPDVNNVCIMVRVHVHAPQGLCSMHLSEPEVLHFAAAAAAQVPSGLHRPQGTWHSYYGTALQTVRWPSPESSTCRDQWWW